MRIVLTNKPEEVEEDPTAARDPNENNQKLGLLAALLRAGAWQLADQVLNRLPRAYCVSQVSHVLIDWLQVVSATELVD